MKKLIVGLLAAAMMTLGLVGTTTGTAHAYCGYPAACLDSKIAAKAPKKVKAGKAFKIKANVKIRYSTTKPQGKVVVNCKPGGIQKTIELGRFGNGNTTIKLAKPGKYKCVATFRGVVNQRNSSDDFTVIVKSNKR
ncbi:hypothetical protein E8D34_05500 [Nocardioides sp. GY 10113]|uniref:hypothetical protein n=1 Tax=Nocardioides sp. GY 10113 TaxID=2569761 RepID=UPI0010A7C02C|nr:hypothetical protein [Nocardioides sp. GY 10113]TIC88380.1 hypothetical protein E8D34_05500 [Nocardioides sp. GY 10113]